jgi:hypothetical protein
VKLLIDENLSRKLVAQSPDATVWEYAKANGFTILTADVDFFELATTLGPPPKFSGYGDGTIRRAMLRAFFGEKQFGSPSLKATLSLDCL